MIGLRESLSGLEGFIENGIPDFLHGQNRDLLEFVSIISSLRDGRLSPGDRIPRFPGALGDREERERQRREGELMARPTETTKMT
jgi:hypothetical protein